MSLSDWPLWVAFALLAGAAALLSIRSRPSDSGASRAVAVAAKNTALVVAAAFLFGLLIWWRTGQTAATLFYTGYVVELSLSVDNLLVFILLFQYFAIPAALQPTVLKWGILGAVVMRLAMILVGVAMLHQFAWLIFALGVLLVITGLRMVLRGDTPVSPHDTLVVRTAEHMLPVTREFHGRAMMARSGARRMATPLLVALIAIEWTDLVFATDSIPAILAVTRDPLLVYTSNVFAIIGLRAMFFVLSNALSRFRYLRITVSVVLIFVGCKMIASRWLSVPPAVTLLLVVLTLGGGVAASLIWPAPASGADS